jgi:hypothetical protein
MWGNGTGGVRLKWLYDEYVVLGLSLRDVGTGAIPPTLTRRSADGWRWIDPALAARPGGDRGGGFAYG